jgi:hypothetical protein
MRYEDLPDSDPEESEPLAANPEPDTCNTPEAVESPADGPRCLVDIPPDAKMDDATLTCWNGRRFVSWQTYVWEQLTKPAPHPLTDDERRHLADEDIARKYKDPRN